jgi:hypothetical protein
MPSIMTDYIVIRPDHKQHGAYFKATCIGPYGDQDGQKGIGLSNGHAPWEAITIPREFIGQLERGIVVTIEGKQVYCATNPPTEVWKNLFRASKYLHDNIQHCQGRVDYLATVPKPEQKYGAVRHQLELELAESLKKWREGLQDLLQSEQACHVWCEMTGELPEPKLKGEAMMLPAHSRIPCREGLDKWLLYRMHLEEIPGGIEPGATLNDPALMGSVRLGWIIATDVEAAADDIKRRMLEINRDLEAAKKSGNETVNTLCPVCGSVKYDKVTT